MQLAARTLDNREPYNGWKADIVCVVLSTKSRMFSPDLVGMSTNWDRKIHPSIEIAIPLWLV